MIRQITLVALLAVGCAKTETTTVSRGVATPEPSQRHSTQAPTAKSMKRVVVGLGSVEVPQSVAGEMTGWYRDAFEARLTYPNNNWIIVATGLFEPAVKESQPSLYRWIKSESVGSTKMTYALRGDPTGNFLLADKGIAHFTAHIATPDFLDEALRVVRSFTGGKCEGCVELPWRKGEAG